MPKSNETIAILGAGLMGTAIAAAFLKRRFPVILFDVSQQVIVAARDRVEAELAMQGVDVPDEMADVLSHLECVDSVAEIARASFVIESITEKTRAKGKLYAQVVPRLADSALLVSNTSTISIDELAATLPASTTGNMAERFCGFHFFHPVRERSLVEIVRGRVTSQETLERVTHLAVAVGKTPMVVNDGPGFVVNRLLNAYLTGALQLLAEGATIRQVDAAAEEFGMAMGPFRVMDEIGLDVTVHGGWVLYKAFPERVEPSPILLELIRDGNLGRKTGCGFYRYESSTMWELPGTDNNRLNTRIAEKYRSGRKSPLTSMRYDTIVDRLIGEMFREGQRILEDGVVRSAAEIELAVVLGLGFPENRWKNPFAKGYCDGNKN